MGSSAQSRQTARKSKSSYQMWFEITNFWPIRKYSFTGTEITIFAHSGKLGKIFWSLIFSRVRLLALEIVVRGEDGRNGMKAQLNKLCDRFDQFEKKAIRVIAVATALPGIVAAVFAALRFFGSL